MSQNDSLPSPGDDPVPTEAVTTESPSAAAQAAPAAAPSASATASAPRRGPLRRFISGAFRWGKRLTIVALVLLLVGRMTMGLWLPSVVNGLAKGYGLNVQWQDLDLSIAGLSLDLSGVRVVPLPEEEEPAEAWDPAAAEPIALLDDLGLDVDVSALFTGKLSVHRVEAGGLQVFLDRNADGVWNLERHAPAPSDPDAPGEPEDGDAGDSGAEESSGDAPEPAEAKTLDFTSPVHIAAVDVHGVRIHLKDALAQPALATVLEAEIALRDIGLDERPATVRITARADDVLDVLRVEGTARTAEAELVLDLDVRLAGLGVGRLAPYLEPLGIRPHAHALNAGLHVGAELSPVQTPGSDVLDLAGSLGVSAIRLDADGDEAVALDDLTLLVRGARSTAFDLESLVVTGLRANATRLADGTLRVAGLDLVGVPPSDQEPESVEDVTESEDAPAAAPTLGLDRVGLVDAVVTFEDRALPNTATQRIQLGLEITDVQLDPARPGHPLGIDLTASIDGSGQIGLTGSAIPTGPLLGADLELTGGDLTLGTLAPYLEAAGLEATLTEGSLAGVIAARLIPATDDAPLRLDASIGDFAFLDGETILAQMGSLAVENLTSDPEAGLRIGRTGLTGGTIPLEVTDTGGFRGIGLQPLGQSDSVEGTSVGLRDAGLELRDFVLGGEQGGRGSLSGSLGLENLAESLALEGTIVTRPGDLDLDMDLSASGTGVRYEGLRKVLAPMGIESTLVNGSLTATFAASVKAEEGSTLVEAELSDVAFLDGSAPLMSLTGARIEGLVAGPGGLTIAAVSVDTPALGLRRDAEGTLHALGLRFGVPMDETAPAAGSAELAAPSTRPGTGTAVPNAVAAAAPSTATDPAKPSDQPNESAPAFVFRLERLALDGAVITWRDEAMPETVDTAFRGQVSVEDLCIGDPTASPVHVVLSSALDGALEAGTIDLTARLDPSDLDVQAGLDLRGLRAGPLGAYLPENLPVLLEDGRLRARLAATAKDIEGGGQAMRLVVDDLDYRDGEQGEPMLAFKGLVVDAPRIDPEGQTFDIAEVSVSGLAFEASRVTETRIEVLGLAIETAPPAAVDADVEADAEVADSNDPEVPPTGAGDPVAENASPTGEATAAPVATIPPTVTLGRLDVGIDRLRFLDRTRPDAVPLDLSLALVTPGPQTLVSPDPVDLPPFEVSLVGAVDPLVGNIQAAVRLQPFSADPNASLDVAVTGIRGADLAGILPEAAEAVDATGFVNGSLTTHVDVQLVAARRGPVDFDLGRGFGALLSVDELYLRPTPEDPGTGFESLDVDLQRMDPATGDIRIRSIDLNGIRASVTKDDRGTTIAGFLLPAPPEPVEGEEPGPVEAAPDDAPADPASDPGANPGAGETPASAGDPGPEIAIDRLAINGLDFRFLDTTADPVLDIPISDLTLEVKRFTTRTFTERRPFDFRLIVDAGEVELPERTGSDHLLGGVFSSMAGALGGDDDQFTVESRRVWDLLEVSGRLSLGPEIRGRVQTSLLGLELPAFRGPARAAGVEIGDGLVDNTTRIRFREDGSLNISKKTTASYLSLSEPPDGPISKYLSLPAPLDTVLFLLRNDQGEQKIPLRLDLPADGVSASGVAGAAAQTLGLLITDAVSSAPLRVLGPLVDVAGALGLSDDPLPANAFALEFAAGTASMDAAQPRALEPSDEGPANLEALGRALRAQPDLRVVVQHELGAEDLAVAERLANPDTASVEKLIERLRGRKAIVERSRVEEAAVARARYAVGALELAEESRVALQSLDIERAEIESALDQAFSLVAPGAERRRDMRTRAAAMALAQERLSRVRAALLRVAGGAADDRVDVRRPRIRIPKEGESLPELGSVSVAPR